MLVFADTGILLRVFDPADPQHANVAGAVRVLQARGDEFVFATQNVAEFWNVCTRPVTARGGLGLSVAETDRRLATVEASFSHLADHPTTYAIWRGLVVRHAVQGKQVHDARLVALMLSHGVAHILTLNGPDFTRYPGITVLDPASVFPAPPVP